MATIGEEQRVLIGDSTKLAPVATIRASVKKDFKRHMRSGYLGDKAAWMFFVACNKRRKKEQSR